MSRIFSLSLKARKKKQKENVDHTILRGEEQMAKGPCSFRDGSLFIHDGWCGFRVLFWTLNLMTCVSLHFYTRGSKFSHRELFHTCIFLLLWLLDVIFLNQWIKEIIPPLAIFMRSKRIFPSMLSPRNSLGVIASE